jgi:hypothetical protein
MSRIRFSLRALLIVATALILLLGYSQWRRRNILQACEKLVRDGYQFPVSDTWKDYLWQQKPTVGRMLQVGHGEAVVHVKAEKSAAGTVMVARTTTDPKEIARLKRLGFVKYE